MRRNMGRLLAAVIILLVVSAPVYAKAANTSKLDTQSETLGPDNPAIHDPSDSRFKTGTEFFISIENKQENIEQNKIVNKTGTLPKTGDSGIDINLWLISAAIFGGAYLFSYYIEQKKLQNNSKGRKL